MTTVVLRQLVTRTNNLLVQPCFKISSFETTLRHISNISSRMSSVYVKSFDNDERLQICLDLTVASGGTKSFNLHRLKNEELRLAMDRLRINLSKMLAKKSKKKKKSEKETEPEATPKTEIPVEMIHNGQTLDLSVSNQQAWVEGAVLKVGDEEILVCYNPPGAKLEKLPATVMVGFPLFPEVETEFTDVRSCDFYWKTFDEKHKDKIKSAIGRDCVDLTDAVKTHSYTPEPSDIGRLILLACIPRNGGKTGKLTAVISSSPVTSGPGPCPFEKRHTFTSERAPGGSFRVMTYNLLANVYSNTDFARDCLFSHCPPDALNMDYRRHLLLKEIIGYNGDLLCMQEVDKSVFSSQLTPALEALGYTGLFRPKAGQVSEGSASFIRNDKFCIVNEADITLSEYLATNPSCEDIWTEVCKIESLKKTIEERSSILQVTVLESIENPGSFICLANTHLYFHPTACNIRLIHVAVALRHLQSLYEAYTQEGKNIAMVFCGDFNSSPHLGVYQLMTAQMVPTDHADWNSAGEEEKLTTLELRQPMNIESACGTPPYTNFTKGFQATLDYIFIDSDKLQVTKVVPLPEHEDVIANVALPSVVFPSDHLALVCELKFR